MNTRSTNFDQWIYSISNKRASQIIQPMLPWLERESGSILDYGCGLGHIGSMISQKTGRGVTYVDIRKYPYVCPEVEIQLFDGKILPYPDSSFHTSMIVLVLHHTPSPRDSLAEVRRVTEKRIIVYEDLIRSRAEWNAEAIKDTITNGFLPHMTYQYKTEGEWEALFTDLRLAVLDKCYFQSRFIFNFRHVIWLLEVNKPEKA